jgi:hypothetical protein
MPVMRPFTCCRARQSAPPGDLGKARRGCPFRIRTIIEMGKR